MLHCTVSSGSSSIIQEGFRGLRAIAMFKLDVDRLRERQKSPDCCAWTAGNANVQVMAYCLILHAQRWAMAAFIARAG
jgi:hypothetical protein